MHWFSGNFSAYSSNLGYLPSLNLVIIASYQIMPPNPMASHHKHLSCCTVYENQESGGSRVGHRAYRFLMGLQLRCLWPSVGLTGTGGPASEMAQRHDWDLSLLGLLERAHVVAAGFPRISDPQNKAEATIFFYDQALGIIYHYFCRALLVIQTDPDTM